MQTNTKPAAKEICYWPYSVNYNKETTISTDVLIIGGGIAGCHAAIAAARKGAKVAIVEKGSVIRSGSGGAGVDHWHCACKNPCSKITPDEMVETIETARGNLFTHEYGTGPSFYILCKESYDALLDVEEFGIKIRDVDDEFAGADFRDEETKLMFAYDYKNRHCIRMAGAKIKPALYEQLKHQGVKIFDRVMTTSLITEEGQQGARVVGATGVNVRTGEFFLFKSKATILSTGPSLRLWVFSTELTGSVDSHEDPNCSGDGSAMAWQAGAEFSLMEASMPSAGGLCYPAYGTGNAHNTWFACTLVDSNGKEIPWVDRDGRMLKTVSERYRPAPGQKLIYHGPPPISNEIQGPRLIPDLPERILKGEFVLPFFADLPGMPEHERRAIFGLMVGNEGKTRVPIYENYTQAGFDPDKDMLQANVLPPEMAGKHIPYWNGVGPPQWRETAFGGGGGLLYDWDLRTTLEGLYAAGTQLAGGGNHAGAAATGRYAGRKAATYALNAKEPAINREQIDKEKSRVYAPVNSGDGIGWKELRAGLARIMQDYCSVAKNKEVLQTGLQWFESIRESDASMAYARNPHELMRVLECFSRITVGEIILHASLARKASSLPLKFIRLDYPETDQPEWDKFIVIKQENGVIKTRDLPPKFWLKPPNAPTYKENYDRHSNL
jgi:succinate dehydrogenase/fumarate reductase flavoprotein subunit